MLGVIAIHIGSQYLLNPTANIHLVALLEVATRFAVPIFFFISAFGLFYNLNLNDNFDYKSFLHRRLKTVLIPYLTWSFLYIIHDSIYYNFGLPSISYLFELLFFGLSKYHLYFLVILLWFYFLMPVWIKLIKRIKPISLIWLLIAQIAFDYFSSYNSSLIAFTYSLSDDSLLKDFFLYRLNWLILHYFFIFILGAYLATKFDKFFDFIDNHKSIITLSFILTFIAMLGYYYFLVLHRNFSLEAAVNTAHQLSPIGILYTITASIFFFMFFTFNNSNILKFFGKHSYFVYLVHPLIIFWLRIFMDKLNLIMTAPNAIILYILTVILSLTFAIKLNRFDKLNKFLIGR